MADDTSEFHLAATERFNDLAWRYLTGPQEQRQPHKALPLAQEAVKLAPKECMYFNTLGVAYYRLGMYPKAVTALQGSLRQLGDTPPAFDLFFLAMCHAQLGDAGKARDCYEQAVRWLRHNQDSLHPVWKKELEAFQAEAESLLVPDKRAGRVGHHS